MLTFRVPPPPLRDDVLAVEPKNRFSDIWERWWQALIDSVASRAQIVASVRLVDQSGTVTETAIPTRDTLPGGLYRLSFTRTPVDLPFGGAIGVSLHWTSGGIAQELSRADATGVVLMLVDEGTTVGYSFILTPPPPSFDMYLVLERVG